LLFLHYFYVISDLLLNKHTQLEMSV